MKFKIKNGEQYIILEENDKINLATKNGAMEINVNRQNGKLDISGNSEIINSIKGDGILDKINFPTTVSKEEIIKACDHWLKMFEEMHDKYKELVLTEKYREQGVSMHLTFEEVFSPNEKLIAKNIALKLKKGNILIQDGVSITIPTSGDDIYKYLIASVLNYYISKNYEDTPINDKNCIDNVLHSKYYDGTSSSPMMAHANYLYNSQFFDTTKRITTQHNLGFASEQLIRDLKEDIHSQILGENFETDLIDTARQLGFLKTIEPSLKRNR